MNNGRNPTRRNRNIGTAKQGHGQNNKLTIPQPADTDLFFYERIDSPEVEVIVVQGMTIPVIIEPLTDGYFYSCTPHDIQKILGYVPFQDIEDFGFIVFRQPKKKEAILSSVWGRLIYSFEFQDAYGPAIIIEATPRWETFTYPKKQSMENALEFKLLKQDGMNFKESKREFVAIVNDSVIRNIQLYRTLLHEIGHYVHFLEIMHRGSTDKESFESRQNFYFKIPKSEKENFANRYATKMKERLIKRGVIPFERIEE